MYNIHTKHTVFTMHTCTLAHTYMYVFLPLNIFSNIDYKRDKYIHIYMYINTDIGMHLCNILTYYTDIGMHLCSILNIFSNITYKGDKYIYFTSVG
jgi:hypothetical protein